MIGPDRREHEPPVRRSADVRVGSTPPGRLVVSIAGRDPVAGRFHWTVFLALACVALILDQLAKYLVSAQLTLRESVSLLGPLSVQHVRNSGIAFGLFSSWTSLVAALTALAVVAMLVYFARAGAGGPVLPIALALLFGGSVSNLADRVRLGYVTDYLDVRYWPTFNLADTFIVCGVLLLVAGQAFEQRRLVR